MQRLLQRASALRGTIRLPGDKSISHRAAIFNAIADGESTLTNLQRGTDVSSTLNCLAKLGVLYTKVNENTVRIAGAGLQGLCEPTDVLNARNSGTTMRLLAGLLAAQPFFTILNGDSSLRARPMDRIIQPLRLMGANIQGRANDSRPPLAINGRPLRGIRYQLPVASAQIKSALILATLYAQEETTLRTEPSRDHTERMLKAMGAIVKTQGRTVTIAPLHRKLRPLSMSIPADISSASFWMAAATLHPEAELRMENVSTNPTRTGIIDALKEMGADITVDNPRNQGPEPVADIVARSSPCLKGVVIDGGKIPRLIDELPVLALVGSLAQGETTIRNALELRVKESDRILTTARSLRRLGARIEELPDGMRIQGVGELHGSTVSTHGDHRLAMTMAVAGLLAKGQTVVHNAQAVAVSYPRFWQDLEQITAS